MRINGASRNFRNHVKILLRRDLQRGRRLIRMIPADQNNIRDLKNKIVIMIISFKINQIIQITTTKYLKVAL